MSHRRRGATHYHERSAPCSKMTYEPRAESLSVGTDSGSRIKCGAGGHPRKCSDGSSRAARRRRQVGTRGPHRRRPELSRPELHPPTFFDRPTLSL